ncbi:metallo-beta-lactamase family hydrolase [Lapidilactobacillus concavus DSM 17758]|uniref:Ribonuclease J n=1 Tax=Lapidilactobacillus concavus DSM 17758 TaxID=1423735 RepID=A0A0R1W2Y7_9LACO|nr:ribonuclease J [Lapidilactobacillus concavus]KRM10244.1 metallo-beta-lactamase family hydrolase [Lapidilactobacillus concavus DSM 17758]GEL13328.1 ribonuclease J [Lapidilactobacillus concavus]
MLQNLKVIPFGGVRENGKNMYAVEVEDEIYILDCGLMYPENELLGIDVVIPDFAYLQENIDRVVGIFLTHGHADAIGGLPYFLSANQVPVFGSKMTIELAKITVASEKKLRHFDDFHVIDEKTAIDFKNATVSFFKTTHSIPGSLGIDLKTEAGHIVYTGDFKFDQAAKPEYQTDFGRLADIGRDHTLMLLSDSSNAESPYANSNEHDISSYIQETFKYHPGRIIVASVASNIERIQQIFNAAALTKRRVVLTGQDLEKIVKTAMALDYLKLPKPDLLATTKELHDLAPEQTIVLETGKMGEPIKSLEKMATNRHRLLHIKEGDLVFITTTPSHAMETTVAKMRDMIYRADGTVKAISDDLHSSGHANKTNLQLMINLLQPDYLMPIQGEYRLLEAHAHIAEETGMATDHIFITKMGDVLKYDKGQFHLGAAVPAGDTMIDGSGVGDIGNIVLRDRRLLADDGIFIAVVTIDRRKKKIVAKPKLTSRGFVYVKANRDLMSESSDIVVKAIENNLAHKEFDWNDLKQDVREDLSKYLFDQTKRHPVILPVIMEVNQNRHR